MSVELSREEFETAVDDALDSIPRDLLDRLENVAILVEEEPTAEQLPIAHGGSLLGLYVGTPLPQRLDSYSFGSVPDRIYIFRGPLTRNAHSREDLVRQIRVTVIHEIGHYFGFTDSQLHEYGWG